MSDGIALKLLDDLRCCNEKSSSDDVDMETYIMCWVNLKRVLDAMGTVFKFVSSDVEDKVNILTRIHGEKSYATLGTMMTKEIEHKVINYERLDDKNPSGSRTALRLHRALKMVSLLLNKIAKNEHDGKMSTIAYESYHGSPMPAHHPWVIRKAIGVAVYTLPDSSTFCKDIAPGVSTTDLPAKLTEAAEIMDHIFDKTDKLFIDNQLQTIP